MRLETNVSSVPSMRLMYRPQGVLMGVYLDDRPYAVQEGYAAGPGGIGEHRYQVLLMPMGNVISAFWRDLGPATDFNILVDGSVYRAPPYFQIVLAEHSVGECLAMAEMGRFDDFSVRLLHEQVNESDLFEKYAQLIDEDLYRVRNRSTFGPGGHTQRSGYSTYGALRQAELIAERASHGR